MTLPDLHSHRSASFRLFHALHRATGSAPHGQPALAALARLCDGMRPVPGTRHPSMRFDAYLTSRGGRTRWGLTMRGLHIGGDFLDDIDELASRLGYAPGVTHTARRVRDALDGRFDTTLGLGFDRPDAPPRIKVYFRETRWGAGVATTGRLCRALVAERTADALPPWLYRRRIDVVALEATHRSTRRAKLYVGAETPGALVRGAPRLLEDLAQRVQRASPAPGYHYATIRLYEGSAPAYAINKLYDPSHMKYGADAAAVRAAREDVAGLFRAAGQSGALERTLERLRDPAIGHVLPTAIALEARGRAADVCLAAYPRTDAARHEPRAPRRGEGPGPARVPAPLAAAASLG